MQGSSFWMIKFNTTNILAKSNYKKLCKKKPSWNKKWINFDNNQLNCLFILFRWLKLKFYLNKYNKLLLTLNLCLTKFLFIYWLLYYKKKIILNIFFFWKKSIFGNKFKIFTLETGYIWKRPFELAQVRKIIFFYKIFIN